MNEDYLKIPDLHNFEDINSFFNTNVFEDIFFQLTNVVHNKLFNIKEEDKSIEMLHYSFNESTFFIKSDFFFIYKEYVFEISVSFTKKSFLLEDSKIEYFSIKKEESKEYREILLKQKLANNIKKF